jgi:branched-chain amino acid transport system ATP-binding protein
LLEIDGISSYYGAIQALHEVSVEVKPGEAVAVLGPNGAGKSTLLRSISGLVRCRRGRIAYQGKDISRARTDAIVRLGIVQVPEGRRVFSQMSVRENLLMGAFVHNNGGGMKEQLKFVYSLFPDLEEKASRMGKELSGGQQQMLAIGRALMGRPSLLLLDEPSLGLSPIMVEQVSQTITSIRTELGTSILLVEQDAGLALELTSRVYVMQSGRVTLAGGTSDISATEIRKAYLGQVADIAVGSRREHGATTPGAEEKA